MTPRLVEPTPSDLRLISPSALALWRALVRVRQDAGVPDSEWFAADLTDLKRRALIGTYATARAALAQLKRAGLVATSRCSQSRWARVGDQLVTVSALEGNLYLVAGSCSRRRGVDSITFPERAWSEFVAARRSGSDAAVEPWRTPVERAEWLPEWGREHGQGSERRSTDLGPDSSPSVIYSITKPRQLEASEKAAGAAVLPDRTADDLVDLISQDDDAPEVGLTSARIGGSAPRPTPLGPASEAPFLPPDSHEAPHAVVMYVSPEMVPEQKARAVIDGYRTAVREVYGVDWWHYWKGDIKKAKHYDKLLACGEQLAEHSVPAEHWAIWRLQWFKDHARAFASKPPPVWVVMSGKTVSERAGWFRKDYELPVPTMQADPIIAEQHLRNREAAQRWRGLTGDAVFLAMPLTYVEKRRDEIAAGQVDPHDAWPTKRGSRYGRT